MPVLIVGGEIQGENPAAKVAGSCEWCGDPVTVEGCKPASFAYYGEGGDVGWGVHPEHGNRVAVLTRLCQGCITIYCELGRDNLRERPVEGENP